MESKSKIIEDELMEDKDRCVVCDSTKEIGTVGDLKVCYDCYCGPYSKLYDWLKVNRPDYLVKEEDK